MKKELRLKYKVISSYEDFAGQPVPDDAKGFTAHHNACKSAVVHAETLLKLARWTADDASSESSPSADWEKILLEARQEADRDEDDEY